MQSLTGHYEVLFSSGRGTMQPDPIEILSTLCYVLEKKKKKSKEKREAPLQYNHAIGIDTCVPPQHYPFPFSEPL